MGANAEKTTYAQDIARVEDIVAKISNGCDVDDMLGLASEAAGLLARCREKLGKTGLEIEEVLKDLKGKDYWEQLMIARKRKTMAVCHNCHLSIHHGKID